MVVFFACFQSCDSHAKATSLDESKQTKTPAKALKRNEAWYRDQWINEHRGEAEVTLPDGSRCDILTDDYAIEVDWAHKWPEAVGQSLWYSYQTNKKPGIVLIVRTDNDRKHLLRLRSLTEHRKLDIRVWVVQDTN